MINPSTSASVTRADSSTAGGTGVAVTCGVTGRDGPSSGHGTGTPPPTPHRVAVGLFELEVGGRGVEEHQIDIELEQIGDGEEHRLLTVKNTVSCLLQLGQRLEQEVPRHPALAPA
jgi:hypothetical protein